MPLTLVALPIGNPKDISQRAQSILASADLVILEEPKEGRAQLLNLGLKIPPYRKLNEHTKSSELDELVEICRVQNVALMSDCGTPNFCDPGAILVRACRQKGIPIHSVPGASSLMTLISLTSQRLDQFVFFGFLPRDASERERSWRQVASEKRAVILMETPYRFHRFLEDWKAHLPHRRGLLACNLTTDAEFVAEGTPAEIKNHFSSNYKGPEDPEFLVLLY